MLELSPHFARVSGVDLPRQNGKVDNARLELIADNRIQGAVLRYKGREGGGHRGAMGRKRSCPSVIFSLGGWCGWVHVL